MQKVFKRLELTKIRWWWDKKVACILSDFHSHPYGRTVCDKHKDEITNFLLEEVFLEAHVNYAHDGSIVNLLYCVFRRSIFIKCSNDIFKILR